MPITAQERAALLRQAATNGRRHPDDLFGLRMAIHDAFESSGVNANRVCDLLIVEHPPISKWDCNRLESVADFMEFEPGAVSGQLFNLCKMVRLLTPS